MPALSTPRGAVPAWSASNCPAGTNFVSFGSLDSANSTLFPENKQGTQLGSYWNPYYQSHTHTHACTHSTAQHTLLSLPCSP